MNNLNITTPGGSLRAIEAQVLAEFRAGLRGASMIQGEPGYDEARSRRH
jgi:hypothetical protein